MILAADFGSEAIAMRALNVGLWEYLKAPVGAREIAGAVSRAVPGTREPVEV